MYMYSTASLYMLYLLFVHSRNAIYTMMQCIVHTTYMFTIHPIYSIIDDKIDDNFTVSTIVTVCVQKTLYLPYICLLTYSKRQTYSHCTYYLCSFRNDHCVCVCVCVHVCFRDDPCVCVCVEDVCVLYTYLFHIYVVYTFIMYGENFHVVNLAAG